MLGSHLLVFLKCGQQNAVNINLKGHMKKLLTTLFIVAATFLASAQTPPPTPSGVLGQVWSDLSTATNIAVVPYAAYGLNNHKLGGGVLGLYNFNNYVGAGIGVDYVGEFSMVSANIELKLPMRPLAPFGLTNFVATPFVFSGLGTPFSGSSGSGVSTHLGAGANFDVTKLWGGQLSVGAAYVTRSGAGLYSDKYVEPFIAWRHGF